MLDISLKKSDFINQSEKKVWELIKESVDNQVSFGDAKISEKHSNFFINSKNASFENISYDFVIDFQGLMRTQIIGSKIKKISSSKNFIGYSFKSAKEGLLTFLYDKRINITKDEHAVMRMKKLAVVQSKKFMDQ